MSSKAVGATLMVAGTAVGAAMLAMPVIIAKVGFICSILFLVIMGIIMTYAAHLVIKMYKILNCDSTIIKIATEQLGKTAGAITLISIVLLLYCLMVAYLSGLSEIIPSIFSFEISTPIMTIILCIIGVVLLTLPDKTIDQTNRICFGLKISCLSTVAILLLPHVTFEKLCASNSLSNVADMSYLGFLALLPIVMTAFGFHSSIPYIYKYLGNDNDLGKKVMTAAGITTCVIYIIWTVLMLGTIPYEGDFGFITMWKSHDELNDLIGAVSHVISNDKLKNFTGVLVLFGILTSLIGVSVGLMDLVMELAKTKNKLIAAAITFFAPAVIVLYDPALFIGALSLAGVLATISIILIPCVIYMKIAPQNKTIPILCIMVGILVIAGELVRFLGLN